MSKENPDNDKKSKKSFFSKTMETISETTNKTLEDIDKRTQKTKDDINRRVNQTDPHRSKSHKEEKFWDRESTNPEKYLYRAYGFFWVIILAFIGLLMSLVLAASDARFLIFALLMIIAFPIILIYSLLQMIPEVKIFGITLWSRKNMNMRQQLSTGGRILRLFSTEFIKANPEIATIIFLFLGLLGLSILLPFFL